MISSINIRSEEVNLAKTKALSGKQTNNFSTLLKKANDELEQNVPAREVLLGIVQR